MSINAYPPASTGFNGYKNIQTEIITTGTGTFTVGPSASGTLISIFTGSDVVATGEVTLTSLTIDSDNKFTGQNISILDANVSQDIGAANAAVFNARFEDGFSVGYNIVNTNNRLVIVYALD